MCQPSSIVAESTTVSLPPADALTGDAAIVQCTGGCANAGRHRPLATTQKRKSLVLECIDLSGNLSDFGKGEPHAARGVENKDSRDAGDAESIRRLVEEIVVHGVVHLP